MSTASKPNGKDLSFNIVVIKFLIIGVVTIGVVGLVALAIVSAVVKDPTVASMFAVQIATLVGTIIGAIGAVLAVYKISNVGTSLTTVQHEINSRMTQLLDMKGKTAASDAVAAERESVAAVAIQVKEAVATQVDNMNVETLTVEKQVKK